MCWLLVRSVALLVFFVSALTHVSSDHHYQIFCNTSQPEKYDCLTLFKAFRDGIFRQRDNLFRLDLVFNPPSGITPVLVRAVYNINLTGIDHCTEDINQTVVLGWTSQSLYRYFHAAIINEVRLQLPYAVLQLLEYFMHSLEDEPFVDDYLWIGLDKALPEVRLSINVDFSNGGYTLSECLSNESIQKALGEITHWVRINLHVVFCRLYMLLLYQVCIVFLQLRAYAKVAQRNNEQAKELANPDYKGYTLPQDAVTHYTNELWNTTRGQVGEGMFIYLYVLNIVITLVLVVYLLLSSAAYKVYDHIVEESDLNKIQLEVAAYLAFAYMILFFIADIIQLTKLAFNWFLIPKFLSAIAITISVVLISAVKYHKSAPSSKNCTKFLVVAVLASLISILALDITPTTVLFFVFPTDSFSLLAIHIALFYTEVMVGTVFVRWLKCQSGKKRCKSVYNSIKEKCKSRNEVRCHEHTYNDTSPLVQDTCWPCYGTQYPPPINIVKERHNGDQGGHDGDRTEHDGDRAERDGGRAERDDDRAERDDDRAERDDDRAKRDGGRAEGDGDGAEHDDDRAEHDDDRAEHDGDRAEHDGDQAEHDGDQGGCNGCQAFICVITGIVSILACAFVYFPAIYFFQFLILRNANNGAFDILIKYIPSIAIGFFGLFIRKKILRDKDEKDEKLWLKLGELLTTEEVDKKNKNDKIYLKSLRAAYRMHNQ